MRGMHTANIRTAQPPAGIRQQVHANDCFTGSIAQLPVRSFVHVYIVIFQL